jgi:adenylate cyclase
VSNGPDFLDQLRKRGVVRAALLYAAAAFAVLEFADIAFSRLGLPESAVTTVLWIGIAGLPIALFAAWAIDLRAERDTSRARTWLSPTTVVGVLALIGLGVGMGYFWGGTEDVGETMESTPGYEAKAGLEQVPTVAVLRFEDLSAHEDHVYFASGLSEEVSTAISRFPGIRVIAPSATKRLYELDSDASAGARELGIEYVLRGSIRRSPGKVRVSARLLDAETGAQLWGQTYDVVLETAALFATQDRIAGQVASALADFSGVIVRSGRAEARYQATNRFEAYDCVLLGLAYLEIHTAEVHGRARECLEQAVHIDPEYADAWAHLAYNYREESHHGYNEMPGSLDRALAAAHRAIGLDASSPMAHFALAQTHISRGEFDAGLAAMERSVEFNPNDTVALASLASYLIRLGDLERGIEIARATAELNPLHPTWLHFDIALYHYLKGQYRDSLDSAARVEIPNHPPTLAVRAAAQAKLGQPEAGATLEALLTTDPRFAQAPLRELQRYFFSEETAAAVAEGLRLAGLETD